MRRLPAWFWLIPILLLTTLLAARQLDADGLWFDELWSYVIAGGAEYGPFSLPEVWQKVASTDPIQGTGYPLLLAAWGGLVGWTEYAVRAMSLFAGLLTVAMSYRLTRDMVSAQAGIYAVLVLSVTALFLHYLHEARTFSLLLLAGTLLLWGYWKLVTAPAWKWRFALALTLGGAGLLYSHYYGVVLIAALLPVHLLVMPKNRTWLRPILPAILTGLLFLPSLSLFLDGYQRYTASGIGVAENAQLTTGDLLQKLVYYAGNGSPLLAGLILALAGLAALPVLIGRGRSVLRPYRAKFSPASQPASGVRILLWLALFTGGILLAMNAVFQMMDASRLRYALLLWIPLAGVMGAGIAWSSRLHKYLPGILALLWLIQGLITAANPAFLHEIEVGIRLRWKTITDVMQQQGLPDDVFVFYIGDYTWDATFIFNHEVHDLSFPAFTTLSLISDEHRDESYARIAQARRLWYGIYVSRPASPIHESMLALIEDEFQVCAIYPERNELTLGLYVRSEVFCPATPATMQFGSGIWVREAHEYDGSMLTLKAGVTLAADVPPEAYSVALHVMDSSDNLVAQTDAPLPNRNFATLQFDLSLADVPPGEYTVYMVVYNWRTGQRLSATSLITGEAADRLILTTLIR